MAEDKDDIKKVAKELSKLVNAFEKTTSEQEALRQKGIKAELASDIGSLKVVEAIKKHIEKKENQFTSVAEDIKDYFKQISEIDFAEAMARQYIKYSIKGREDFKSHIRNIINVINDGNDKSRKLYEDAFDKSIKRFTDYENKEKERQKRIQERKESIFNKSIQDWIKKDSKKFEKKDWWKEGGNVIQRAAAFFDTSTKEGIKEGIKDRLKQKVQQQTTFMTIARLLKGDWIDRKLITKEQREYEKSKIKDEIEIGKDKQEELQGIINQKEKEGKDTTALKETLDGLNSYIKKLENDLKKIDIKQPEKPEKKSQKITIEQKEQKKEFISSAQTIKNIVKETEKHIKEIDIIKEKSETIKYEGPSLIEKLTDNIEVFVNGTKQWIETVPKIIEEIGYEKWEKKQIIQTPQEKDKDKENKKLTGKLIDIDIKGKKQGDLQKRQWIESVTQTGILKKIEKIKGGSLLGLGSLMAIGGLIGYLLTGKTHFLQDTYNGLKWITRTIMLPFKIFGMLGDKIPKLGEAMSKLSAPFSRVIRFFNFSIGDLLGKFFKGFGGKVAGEGAKLGLKRFGIAALRRIPVIGSLISLFFAWDRWKKGDKLGALLTAASAIASVVPIAGTALSVAIDSFLVFRDLKNIGKTQENIKTTPTGKLTENQIAEMAKPITEEKREPTATTVAKIFKRKKLSTSFERAQKLTPEQQKQSINVWKNIGSKISNLFSVSEPKEMPIGTKSGTTASTSVPAISVVPNLGKGPEEKLNTFEKERTKEFKEFLLKNLVPALSTGLANELVKIQGQNKMTGSPAFISNTSEA